MGGDGGRVHLLPVPLNKNKKRVPILVFSAQYERTVPIIREGEADFPYPPLRIFMLISPLYDYDAITHILPSTEDGVLIRTL